MAIQSKKNVKVYSAADEKRLINLKSLKNKAFEDAVSAHANVKRKLIADKSMAVYLEEAAACALLGTPLVTRNTSGTVTKIYNYVADCLWLAHAPEFGAHADYGTYKKLPILFDNIKPVGEQISCQDAFDVNDNMRYLSGDKSITIVDDHYLVDRSQFISLKKIDPPKDIKLLDYFLASSFSCQFKPIQSFSSNPWSDNIDSFVCNSSYSMRGFCGDWRGGRVIMIQTDATLLKLLKNATIWI